MPAEVRRASSNRRRLNPELPLRRPAGLPQRELEPGPEDFPQLQLCRAIRREERQGRDRLHVVWYWRCIVLLFIPVESELAFPLKFANIHNAVTHKLLYNIPSVDIYDEHCVVLFSVILFQI